MVVKFENVRLGCGTFFFVLSPFASTEVLAVLDF